MRKLLLLLFLIPLVNLAQSRRETYIDTYKDIAIREMKIYGIPASITLAQGILESGDGQSRLATKANNHFGIKCHNGWTGGRIYHDDDEKGECFRKYKHAEASFRDHSEFLTTRSRYAFLFELDRTDYRGWAKGLQKAGYATSTKYSGLLIRIIEENNLQQYDMDALDGDLLTEERIMYLQNGARYVVLNEGETLEDLAVLYKRSVRKLLKYNDLTYDAQLQEGDWVFIRKKKWKGKNKYYRAEYDDTMHHIAQQHGIQLYCLYWRNRKPAGWQPSGGETIRLKGRVKK